MTITEGAAVTAASNSDPIHGAAGGCVAAQTPVQPAQPIAGHPELAGDASGCAQPGVSTPGTLASAQLSGSLQLGLPFFTLPIPPYVSAKRRTTDKPIQKALDPLRHRKPARLVYLVLLERGRGSTPVGSLHVYAQIGYATIAENVRKRWGVVLSKDCIREAIKLLKELKYLQGWVPASLGKIETTYTVLTFSGAMQMFRAAGGLYFRNMQHNKVKLILPI